MIHLELRCRLDKCIIDNLAEMELKKCITQNNKNHPDKFQPCPYLNISKSDEFKKGEVWKKFGDIIDKSKSNGKRKLS